MGHLHIEKMPMIEALIELLRADRDLSVGSCKRRLVQLRRNAVPLRALPHAFDGFTILHLSDLHADMSAPAMERVAEVALGLEYDLCVLTGDYRGRTYGDCRPCLEGVASLREALRGDIYAALGNHDLIVMVPDLEALGIRVLLNECVAIDRARPRSIFPGSTTPIFTAPTISKRRRRPFRTPASRSCSRTPPKFTDRRRTPVSI